jgi:hypothetical protein
MLETIGGKKTKVVGKVGGLGFRLWMIKWLNL